MLWMHVYGCWYDVDVAAVAIFVSAMHPLRRLHPMMAWMLSQEQMSSLAKLPLVEVQKVDVDVVVVVVALQILLLSVSLKKKHDWHDVVEVVPFLHLPCLVSFTLCLLPRQFFSTL